MILSKTSEYAIRVLTYIAAKGNQVRSTKVLSDRLKIPYKYLSQIMNKLSVAGFLEPVQGKYGGYRVYKEFETIYLYQIIDILEGMEVYEGCLLGFPKCDSENPCPMHESWEKPREIFLNMLFKTTIEDLINNKNKRF